ncbi:GPP34 family phosphoprotein [Actinoplanes sp. NPDC049596]|uniref:GOLPH3/VPS74 family protein n=1 Tax=unclassified Actinoplanes TaxID=2626549 RepID=UPI00342A8FC1
MTQRLGPPTLAEDLLLLLFQPSSGPGGAGVVAGEETLPYALAGAMLAELSIGGHVRTLPGWSGSTRVEAVAERPPADDLPRSTWDYLASMPRDVQATLAVIGPALRRPLLERLIERNDVHRRTGVATEVPPREMLTDGESGRRRSLLRGVRDVLVGEAKPEPRLAALTALLSASGTLPHFHPEIPLNPATTARAKRLKHDIWAADAAADALARSFAATVVDNVILAAAVLPRL